jgi:carbon storage regulator
MLVLSRKVGERVLIGEDIEVVVVRLRNGHVRLGIAAPPQQKIMRSELLQRPQRPDGPDDQKAA